MKYAKYLARQSIPEWSEHYFKYKKLKKELKLLVRLAETHPSDFQDNQREYVDSLYSELQSVNDFYQAKEKELQDQYSQLKALLAENWKQKPKSIFPGIGRWKSSGLLRRSTNAGLAPLPKETKKEQEEIGPPISSEASLHRPPSSSFSSSTASSSSFPPPKIDTSFPPSSESPERSPIRDSEIPQPFLPDSSEKVPKRVLLAKKYRFSIKRALEEVHRGLGMLKDFAALNSVGFRKIIKKHDKVPNFPSLSYFLEHEVYNSAFHTSNVAATLMSEVETAYANLFTRGNIRQATDKLKIPNIEHEHYDWVSFRFGMCIGACAILALYLCGKPTTTAKNAEFSAYILYVFRFLGIPVFWLWTFAAVMLIWNSVRINYVFIFGWDPRKHISPRHLFEIAATLSLLWLAAFTGYYNSQLGHYPFAYIYGPLYPLALLVVVFVCTVLPFNLLYRSSRWWMFQTMGRIVRTPLLPVKFKDFFYTNQFTSMKNAFSDMGDTLYFYLFAIWREDSAENASQWNYAALVYRPILQAYPAILRFLQCVRRYRDSKDRRHLINTGKYTFSAMTVIASGIRKAFPTSIPILCIYCIIASVSTMYSWLWDVMMDWDLGHHKHNMLRGKLMYKKPWIYYLAAVTDLALRGVWAVTLGLTVQSVSFSASMNTVATISEILRRFVWNIFRLENEHLKNCNQSNATAIPSLLAVYQQLQQNSSSKNANLQHALNSSATPFFSHNDNMHDYEMEEEGGDEEEEEEMGVEEVETVQERGLRHRHVAIGAARKQPE